MTTRAILHRSWLLLALPLAACGGHASPTPTTPDDEAAASEATPPPPLPVVEGFPALDAPGSCGAFEELGALTPQPALAGRLSIGLPSDASSEARPHNLMSAPAGDDHETRFLIDRGESRMVIFVEETFAEPGSAFAASVATAEAARIERGTVAHVRLPSGLDAAIAEPSSIGGPPGGIVVAEAWVTTGDGTVAVVGVFVTPDVGSAPSGCAAVARRIVESVAPGAARLELAGGPRNLGDLVTIELPPRHIVVHDVGPDFEVFRVHPITALGAPGAVLGIYLGDHPSFEPSGSERAGELLGQATSWYASDEDGVSRREALAELDGHGYVHAFVEAASSEGAEALVRVASTMRPAP